MTGFYKGSTTLSLQSPARPNVHGTDFLTQYPPTFNILNVCDRWSFCYGSWLKIIYSGQMLRQTWWAVCGQLQHYSLQWPVIRFPKEYTQWIWIRWVVRWVVWSVGKKLEVFGYLLHTFSEPQHGQRHRKQRWNAVFSCPLIDCQGNSRAACRSVHIPSVPPTIMRKHTHTHKHTLPPQIYGSVDQQQIQVKW